MKNERIGEALWYTWDGHEYETQLLEPQIYVTEGHVDIEHDLVKTALASSLQRDGIVYSLKQGFDLIDRAVVDLTWAGTVGGDWVRSIVDITTGLSLVSQEPGEDIIELTVVEIPVGDN